MYFKAISLKKLSIKFFLEFKFDVNVSSVTRVPAYVYVLHKYVNPHIFVYVCVLIYTHKIYTQHATHHCHRGILDTTVTQIIRTFLTL